MIDWQRVCELQSEFGDDGFVEVVELFLDEVEAALGNISAEPSGAGLQDHLHFLKGASLNLGFSTLAERCRDLEAAIAASPDTPACDGTLRAVFDESKKIFLEGIA